MTGTTIPLHCACCGTFIAMAPAIQADDITGELGPPPPAACLPCYTDEEFGRSCRGPYRYVEWEHDDGSFELIVIDADGQAP